MRTFTVAVAAVVALASASAPITDPCKKIECGNLVCPGGSKLAELPGHCCPYCDSTVVIPDTKDYSADAKEAFKTYKTAKYAGGTGLVQAPITDPCKKIECGELKCPGGSKMAEMPGHCCPYCESTVVIPDTKDYSADAKEAFKTYKTAKYAGGTGLLQKGEPFTMTDPCKNMECGELTCPGGSKLAEMPGHCCPYCDSTVVIPDTKDYSADAKEAFKNYKTAKYAGGTGLLQKSEPFTMTDPCKNMECGELTCPGGSKLSEMPGHCCPYCDSTVVIPDTKDYSADAKEAFKSYKTAKYAGGTGLLQKGEPFTMTDPCKNMECGELTCPGGSKLAEMPGHCCPYCDSTVVIPDTKDYSADAKEAFKSYKTAKYAGGTGLFQKGAPITDPCKKIECGNLKCPGGSKLAEMPGHCCPYCDSTVVIPDTKDYSKDAKEAFKSYKTAKYAGGTGLLQKSPDISDPCEQIECGELTCPGGSKLAEEPGHCCPYCESTVVIIDTKVYAKEAKKALRDYKTAEYAGGSDLA